MVRQKNDILRNQRDFVLIYNKGKSQPGKYVIVLFRKNRTPNNRIAFLASKKVGNSVKRNRARRLMKEAYRDLEGQIIRGFDIIFVARSGIDGVMKKDVYRSMKGALSKASLIKKGTTE